ncbi:MAG: hypothetical protein KAT15_17850, partial [Bacteroidales bacterium]|nr:hypothetical protein [Bacteroidales bacterium]
GYQNPFRPGMSATVDIQTEILSDVLSVPLQAVTTRSDSILADSTDEDYLTKNEGSSSDEMSEVVFLIKEGKAEVIKVKTGIQDNNYIQILEGPEEGDEIIVAPYNAISKKLKQGTSIEVVKKEDLFKDDKKKKKKE